MRRIFTIFFGSVYAAPPSLALLLLSIFYFSLLYSLRFCFLARAYITYARVSSSLVLTFQFQFHFACVTVQRINFARNRLRKSVSRNRYSLNSSEKLIFAFLSRFILTCKCSVFPCTHSAVPHPAFTNPNLNN